MRLLACGFRETNAYGVLWGEWLLASAIEVHVVVELYYYPSYVSLFPHILLHEIGIEHRLIFVDRYASAHKQEPFLKLNPNGLIPV